MRRAKPSGFYWYGGFTVGAILLTVLAEALPRPNDDSFGASGFWLLLGIAILIAFVTWRSIFRLLRQPIWFRATADGPLEPIPLRPPLVRWTVALAFTAAILSTAILLPTSPTAQLFFGFRSRKIRLAEAPFSAADFQPADIYLLPLRNFPPGAAARLAADLRLATGLQIAALPAFAPSGVEYDQKRRQIAIESIAPSMGEHVKTLRLPRPPRPCTPLVVGLTDEDAFTRREAWRFVFSTSFNPVMAAVCTARLDLDLPLDDTVAKQVMQQRAKKLILRLIAFHCLKKEADNDTHSLTGITLRGIPDLDRREDFVRNWTPLRSRN